MNLYLSLFIDNRKHINNLPESEKDCIKRLCRYLKAAPVSLAELEWMRKEFIGMAEEANGRGETLASTIGIREIEFCTELAKSCAKPCIMEMIISWACSCLVSLFIAFSILWALSGFSDVLALTASFLVYVVLWNVYIILSNNLFQRKTAYFPCNKKLVFNLGYIAVCVPILLLARKLVNNNVNFTRTLYVTGWITMLVLGILAVISTLILLYYLNRKLRTNNKNA